MEELDLESLAAQLRGEGQGDLSEGVGELAEALANCAEEDEAFLCNAVHRSGVVPLLLRALSSGLEDKHLLYLALSVLVNLADVGGAEIVLRYKGFELLLSLVDAPEPNTRYYACAGIQNVSAARRTPHTFHHGHVLRATALTPLMLMRAGHPLRAPATRPFLTPTTVLTVVAQRACHLCTPAHALSRAFTWCRSSPPMRS
jgi:hypothetical protein